MARTKIRFYLDVVITRPDMTPAEREEELQRLKEECDKLTDWPEIYQLPPVERPVVFFEGKCKIEVDIEEDKEWGWEIVYEN